MKIHAILFIIYCPVLLFAQKGTLKPEIKSESNTSRTNGIRTWMLEDYLLNCKDSLNKCYLVKENNMYKTVPRNDVSEFFYEEGYEYILLVKEEAKKTSTSTNSYTVQKVVSKKMTTNATSPEPTTTMKIATSTLNKENTNTSVVNEKKDVQVSDVKTIAYLKYEIEVLKEQIIALKKQVDAMQLQLIQKNN